MAVRKTLTKIQQIDMAILKGESGLFHPTQLILFLRYPQHVLLQHHLLVGVRKTDTMPKTNKPKPKNHAKEGIATPVRAIRALPIPQMSEIAPGRGSGPKTGIFGDAAEKVALKSAEGIVILVDTGLIDAIQVRIKAR